MFSWNTLPYLKCDPDLTRRLRSLTKGKGVSPGNPEFAGSLQTRTTKGGLVGSAPERTSSTISPVATFSPTLSSTTSLGVLSVRRSMLRRPHPWSLLGRWSPPLSRSSAAAMRAALMRLGDGDATLWWSISHLRASPAAPDTTRAAKLVPSPDEQ